MKDASDAANLGGNAFAAVSAYGESLMAWAQKHRRALKLVALLAALTLFFGGLYLSLRANPELLTQVRFGPLLAILVLTAPMSVAISAADFQLLARLSGVSVKFWLAVETTIYTRAANMLPIPGSMAVRMAVLKGRGATFKRSGGLMFIFTAIWGGAGFCYSAAWLSFQAPLFYALSFGAVGALILAACVMVVRRIGVDVMSISKVAGLRFALIALEAFTLMLAVRALGVDVAYQQTAILVVASFLASLTQAAIGVREAIIAAIAPLAGIDPATGFLAGAAARVMGMTFLGIGAAVCYAASLQRPSVRP